MRYARVLLVFVCTGLLLQATSARASAPARTTASSGPCLPINATTLKHLHYVRAMASSSAPAAATWRASTKVPQLTDTVTNVIAISDSALCATALTAFNTTAELTDSAATEIQLLRVDTVYVASHPSIQSGEFVMSYVFDLTFHFLGAYLQ